MENKDICIKCNEKKVFCKKMCKTCYGKETRSTPEYKEKMKLYNKLYYEKIRSTTEGKDKMNLKSKKWRSSPKGKENTKLNNQKLKEYRNTSEGKEKRKLYTKKYLSTPEGKEKIKLYNKKYRSTPEGKEKIKLYNKKYISTPEGKEKRKLYNATKGLIARAKYLSKKPPKPPKEIKICDCGGIVIAKNLCRNCYQRKRDGYSLTKRKKLDYTEIYKKIFEDVLNLVKKGNSIQNSFKILGVHSSEFYKKTTPIQKKELKNEKLIAKGLKNHNYLD